MSDLEMMGLFAYSQKGISQPLAMVLSADILHATSVYHAGHRARCLLHHALVSCSDHLTIRAFLA
jgi:hypothetical protein